MKRMKLPPFNLNKLPRRRLIIFGGSAAAVILLLAVLLIVAPGRFNSQTDYADVDAHLKKITEEGNCETGLDSVKKLNTKKESRETKAALLNYQMNCSRILGRSNDALAYASKLKELYKKEGVPDMKSDKDVIGKSEEAKLEQTITEIKFGKEEEKHRAESIEKAKLEGEKEPKYNGSYL